MPLEMDLDQALTIIAQGIWHNGESKHIGSVCLIPSDVHSNLYNLASDWIIKCWNCTHFDRKWETKGKRVILRFYRGDAFGAAIITEDDLVTTKIVDIQTDEFRNE